MDFSKKLKPGAKVLDIGCGTGKPVALFLAEKGHHVTGIDLSEKMIELAQNNDILNAKFHYSDFFDFETSETFDGILAWDSFFHFPLHSRCRNENIKQISGLSAGAFTGAIQIILKNQAGGQPIDFFLPFLPADTG